jgi:hypothetical protein
MLYTWDLLKSFSGKSLGNLLCNIQSLQANSGETSISRKTLTVCVPLCPLQARIGVDNA